MFFPHKNEWVHFWKVYQVELQPRQVRNRATPTIEVDYLVIVYELSIQSLLTSNSWCHVYWEVHSSW